MKASKREPHYLALIKALTVAAGVTLAGSANVGCLADDSADESGDVGEALGKDEQAAKQGSSSSSTTSSSSATSSSSGGPLCPELPLGCVPDVSDPCSCVFITGPLAPPDLAAA